MRLVTIVSLAASAVLGLGALFVAKIALPNAASAKAPATIEAQGEPLVVASRAIKYGEKLNAGMLKVIKVPKSAVPAGAFTTVPQALAADEGAPPVALTPIAQHEALLPTKISGPGARPTVAAEIAEGMRAYTLKVDDASGVGGHALPGDRVDVVLMRDLTPDGPQRNFISYVVVQNARVLGVDLNADPTSEKPSSPNTATLEVSVEDAQKLSVATTLGQVSLALRRNGQADIASAPPVRTGDFLSGGGAARGGPRAVSRGPAASSGILIIEGESVKRERASRAAKVTVSSKPAADAA
ncbi:Flp pilus assembly protein CpaB [Phenylobacterium kunshanense]|uniref:Flp pilus assembly protein CpaB n=1 Tax=Phenylobacterium kunshanense TaxID=1445034 RepID=A0A328BCQ7_9CAUL|nr:Flp pilus assembly protein CpaB [Phenylobacterium kunshanense]RAK64767.1 Flp pilus assembly protein CpaB [Phenylobacterium kunshanense]